MALNAATARLLELARVNHSATGSVLLRQLAGELGMDPERVIGFGGEQLTDFIKRAVIVLH